MSHFASRPHRCGIILSGGNGERLQPFIRWLLNEDLPKQYVRFVGERSLLQYTIDRAERLIDPGCLFTVVASCHLNYAAVCRQLETRPAHTIILQPRNRDTGPALILSLAHLIQRYPNSTVAVFPSDHLMAQEDIYRDYLRRAYEVIEACPSKIIFLGTKATEATAAYSYILPEFKSKNAPAILHPVKTFIESPTPRIAAQVVELGALWNTGIMVFRPEVLVDLIAAANPKLHYGFRRILKALNTAREAVAIEKIYRDMPAVDFYGNLLGLIDVHSRNQFCVLSMEGVFWSDCDYEAQVLTTIEMLANKKYGPRDYETEHRRNYLPVILGAGIGRGFNLLADVRRGKL